MLLNQRQTEIRALSQASLMPSDIEKILATHFCHDWDQRWKDDLYMCKYRIGNVEEDRYFTRSDVEESIETATNVMRSIDGPRVMDTCFIIEAMSHNAMKAVESYVRYKHKLPNLSKLQDKSDRQVVKSLAKGDPSRRNSREKKMWSFMLFGIVGAFLAQPANANCLIVDDVPASGGDLVRASPRLMSMLSGELVAKVKQELPIIGVRKLSSMKISTC